MVRKRSDAICESYVVVPGRCARRPAHLGTVDSERKKEKRKKGDS